MSMPRIVLITCPDLEVARSISRSLVERRLVACVNMIPGMTSVYRYEGEIHEDAEVLLVCKTVAARIDALEDALRELHPYDVPECVALEPSHVEQNYLAWLTEETRLG